MSMENIWGAFIGVVIAIVAIFVATLIITGWLAIFNSIPWFAIVCLIGMGAGGYLGAKHMFPTK